jgi:hypothetical protein
MSLNAVIESLTGVPIAATVVPLEHCCEPGFLLDAAMSFGRSVVEGQCPKCITCEHEWADLSYDPPRALAIARAYGVTDGKALVSGICEACCEEQCSSIPAWHNE